MSGKSDRVGRSGARTYSKHEVLNRFVGKEIAVVNTPRFRKVHARCEGLVWIDLTAGDAALQTETDDWRKNCSPGILAHHAAYKQNSKRIQVILVEKDVQTYKILLNNLELRLSDLGYTRTRQSQWSYGGRATVSALNMDSHDLRVDFIRQTDAVLVLNDPNGVPTWAMRETFPREISERTHLVRTFSTLGWNVAGAKAWASRQDRIQRYDLLAPQIRNLGPSRDLCLAWIDRDDAQWAYLLETPSVWRDQTGSEISRAFGRNNLDVEVTWCRENSARFRIARTRMALTKDEYSRIRGREVEWDRASQQDRFKMLGPEEKPKPKPRKQPQADTLF